MWYLDNAGSSQALPNENYARELMELHTMGAGAYFGKNPGGGDVSAKGFTDNDIGRIHSPIGLDIDAVSPAEIAVAIMGEITQALRQEVS